MNKIISQRIVVFNFFSMIMMLFIHAYNLDDSLLKPDLIVKEQMSLTNFIEYFLSNGLFRYRSSLLMAVSGFLVACKDDIPYIDLIKKKFKTLALPYVLASLITLLSIFVLELVIFRNSHYGFWGIKVQDFSFSQFVNRVFISPIPFQLWYLRILFIFMLFYPLIKKTVLTFPVLFLTGLFIFRFFTFDHFSSLFFFASGILIQKKLVNVTELPKRFSFKLFALLVFGLLTLKTWLAFHGNIFDNVTVAKYIQRGLYFSTELFCVVLMWFGIDLFSKKVAETKWFQAVAGSSFFIYAFHEPVMGLSMRTYMGWLNNNFYNARILEYVTLPFFVLFLCILLNHIVYALFPSLHNILTGSRGKIKIRTKSSNELDVANRKILVLNKV